MKSAVALVTAAAMAWLSAPADAKCMQLELRPTLLTTKVQVTPAGGGIVVGTQGAGRDDKTESAADVSKWKIRGGKKLETPVVTTLAPGLVLYSTPGSGDLVNARSKRLGTLTRTKAALPELEAPKAVTIKHSGSEVRRWQEEDTLVELTGTVPDGAIAMILYDAKGTALTWNIANPGAVAVRVYSFGHCDVANGTRAPSIGDQVTLAWVDRNGRLSPMTKPIAVVKAE